MTVAKSFQSILEEKMASFESEKTTFTEDSAAHSPLESGPVFDLMSQLLGSTQPTFFENKSTSSILKTSYKTTAPAEKKQKASTQPPVQELTVLITQLTSAQKTALLKMISLGATELKDITLLGESRVKKCFRRLAKSYHPDHQNNSKANLKNQDGFSARQPRRGCEQGCSQQSSQSFRELRESYNILIGAFSKAQRAA